jgi:hypothetical protein
MSHSHAGGSSEIKAFVDYLDGKLRESREDIHDVSHLEEDQSPSERRSYRGGDTAMTPEELLPSSTSRSILSSRTTVKSMPRSRRDQQLSTRRGGGGREVKELSPSVAVSGSKDMEGVCRYLRQEVTQLRSENGVQEKEIERLLDETKRLNDRHDRDFHHLGDIIPHLREQNDLSFDVSNVQNIVHLACQALDFGHDCYDSTVHLLGESLTLCGSSLPEHFNSRTPVSSSELASQAARVLERLTHEFTQIPKDESGDQLCSVKEKEALEERVVDLETFYSGKVIQLEENLTILASECTSLKEETLKEQDKCMGYEMGLKEASSLREKLIDVTVALERSEKKMLLLQERNKSLLKELESEQQSHMECAIELESLQQMHTTWKSAVSMSQEWSLHDGHDGQPAGGDRGIDDDGSMSSRESKARDCDLKLRKENVEELERLEEERNQLTRSIESLQSDMQSVVDSKRMVEMERDVTKDQCMRLREECKEFSEMVGMLNKKFRGLESDHKKLRIEHTECCQQLVVARENALQMESKLTNEIGKCKEFEQKMRSLMDEVEGMNDKDMVNTTHYESLVDRLTKQLEEIGEKCRELDGDVESLSEQLASKRNELSNVSRELVRMTDAERAIRGEKPFHFSSPLVPLLTNFFTLNDASHAVEKSVLEKRLHESAEKHRKSLKEHGEMTLHVDSAEMNSKELQKKVRAPISSCHIVIIVTPKSN